MKGCSSVHNVTAEYRQAQQTERDRVKLERWLATEARREQAAQARPKAAREAPSWLSAARKAEAFDECTHFVVVCLSAMPDDMTVEGMSSALVTKFGHLLDRDAINAAISMGKARFRQQVGALPEMRREAAAVRPSGEAGSFQARGQDE